MEDPPNRDSSERILALEALRASEERYRLLFDRSPLPMWVYDQETLGYSSLSYLHRMPIDLLKIDASFVQTMATDEKNRRIVETILALGKNLGVEVIAEGVETAQQAQVLTRLGCDYVQGYLFSEAVDLDAAARLVKSEAPFAPAALKLPA